MSDTSSTELAGGGVGLLEVPSPPGQEAEDAPSVRGRLRRFGTWLLGAWVVAGFVYLFVPIAVIIVFSFNDPRGRFNIVWQEFTFDNWAHPFADESLTDAMSYSLEIALIASLVATVMGTLIGMALCRYRFRGGTVVNLLLVLPLTTPEVVLGAALANLFIDNGYDRGTGTILISHILFCVSFVAITVKARIRGFDWTLEDAAMDLGARPLRTFLRVTLPLIAPGVLAAFLLSFALSIDDFIITFFNAGARNTFPLQVFGASRVEISPQMNVLATMLLLVSVTFLLVGSLWSRRRALRVR